MRRQCPHCGQVFKVQPNTYGFQKFCSARCRTNGRRQGLRIMQRAAANDLLAYWQAKPA